MPGIWHSLCLVVFEGHNETVHGDGIKYIDYLSGVNLEEQSPTEIPVDLRSFDFKSIISTDKIEIEIINKVYEVMVSAFNNKTSNESQ